MPMSLCTFGLLARTPTASPKPRAGSRGTLYCQRCSLWRLLRPSRSASQPSPQQDAIAFLDDAYILAPPSRVHDLYRHFEMHAFQRARLCLNPAKTPVWNSVGVQRPPLSSPASALEIDGLIAHPANVHTRSCLRWQGCSGGRRHFGTARSAAEYLGCVSARRRLVRSAAGSRDIGARGVNSAGRSW